MVRRERIPRLRPPRRKQAASAGTLAGVRRLIWREGLIYFRGTGICRLLQGASRQLGLGLSLGIPVLGLRSSNTDVVGPQRRHDLQPITMAVRSSGARQRNHRLLQRHRTYGVVSFLALYDFRVYGTDAWSSAVFGKPQQA